MRRVTNKSLLANIHKIDNFAIFLFDGWAGTNLGEGDASNWQNVNASMQPLIQSYLMAEWDQTIPFFYHRILEIDTENAEFGF